MDKCSRHPCIHGVGMTLVRCSMSLSGDLWKPTPNKGNLLYLGSRADGNEVHKLGEIAGHMVENDTEGRTGESRKKIELSFKFEPSPVSTQRRRNCVS